MKTIETERLAVRNFREEDWRDLQEYMSRKEVLEFEPHWNSSDEACKEAARAFARADIFWAAELKSEGKMIGHVYFKQLEPARFCTWSLGYIFNPRYYRNGYATEACKAVLQFAFDELGTHRVVARCNTENERSWRLMERLSMRREGHNLKCVTFKRSADGKPMWWDEYQYAILAEEWPRFECKWHWGEPTKH